MCQDILQLQAALRMHQFWAQIIGLRCHPPVWDMRRYWSIRHSKFNYLLFYGGYCFWCVCTGMRLRHFLPWGKVEILLVVPMRHAYEGQSTNQSYFFTFSLMWVPGMEHRLPGLCSNYVYPLSHVSGLPSTFCLRKALSLAWNFTTQARLISSMTFDSAVRELPGPSCSCPHSAGTAVAMPGFYLSYGDLNLFFRASTSPAKPSLPSTRGSF